MEAPDERLDATDARRELAFAFLALVSIGIGLSRLADPGPAPAWLKALDVAIATSFALEWAYRVRRAPRRLRYALRQSYEIVTFVPYTLIAPGAGILRGARLIRLARLARLGALLRLAIGLRRLPRRVSYLMRLAGRARLAGIFAIGALLVVAGAAGLYATERAAVGLRGFGGALWWSLSLFTTVAYAVPSPATPAGHAVASFIMVTGVGFIGVFTASLASAILTTPDED